MPSEVKLIKKIKEFDEEDIERDFSDWTPNETFF
jgi:hypothetical protein